MRGLRQVERLSYGLFVRLASCVYAFSPEVTGGVNLDGFRRERSAPHRFRGIFGATSRVYCHRPVEDRCKMFAMCKTCKGTGRTNFGVETLCHVCGGVGWHEDGTDPLDQVRKPPGPDRTDSEGLLSSNKSFSALVGWAVAGYLFWKMYLSGALEKDWYFIAPIVAGCLATWMLRRADWLCTILRRMVLVAIFCGALAVAYFFLKS